MTDVVLNKAEIIERAITRVSVTYAAHRDTLQQDLDAQDVIVLNLQRTCEAAIDLAEFSRLMVKQFGSIE